MVGAKGGGGGEMKLYLVIPPTGVKYGYLAPRDTLKVPATEGAWEVRLHSAFPPRQIAGDSRTAVAADKWVFVGDKWVFFVDKWVFFVLEALVWRLGASPRAGCAVTGQPDFTRR